MSVRCITDYMGAKRKQREIGSEEEETEECNPFMKSRRMERTLEKKGVGKGEVDNLIRKIRKRLREEIGEEMER